jgi:hypothetical protein
MKDFLDGKKTYIVAALLIVFAVTGVLTGNLTADEAFVLVLNGLGLGALRSGISKQ